MDREQAARLPQLEIEHTIQRQLGGVAMYVGSIRALILGLVCFGVLALHLRSASAETGSADLVLQKVAALEARVAALETKNREYKREAEEARAQVRAARERIPTISRLIPSAVAASATTPFIVVDPKDRTSSLPSVVVCPVSGATGFPAQSL